MTKRLRLVLAFVAGAAMTALAAPASADGIKDNPLARFNADVCPGVVGLAPETAGVMVSRLRENASALGIDLADAGDCKPNLTVAFVSDGQAFLERIDRETDRLVQLSRNEVRSLLGQPGPIRAWVMSEELTRDGQPVGVRENLVDIPGAKMWSAHSRIYVPTRRDITSATILVDRDAVEGLTIAQIADFATLFGLTDRVPEASASTPSIQHLFDSEASSEGLSEFDLSFLRRLYTLPPNLPAASYVAGLEGFTGLRE